MGIKIMLKLPVKQDIGEYFEREVMDLLQNVTAGARIAAPSDCGDMIIREQGSIL
jgi:hypothetical protein